MGNAREEGERFYQEAQLCELGLKGGKRREKARLEVLRGGRGKRCREGLDA